MLIPRETVNSIQPKSLSLGSLIGSAWCLRDPLALVAGTPHYCPSGGLSLPSIK